MSELMLGGYDQGHMVEKDLHYTKVVDSRYWAINMDGIKINGKAYKFEKEDMFTLIDSGSSLLHIP